MSWPRCCAIGAASTGRSSTSPTRANSPCASRDGDQAAPLEELQWLTGLVTGAGQSLGAWDPRDPVRLSRWPNFALLAHRQFT